MAEKKLCLPKGEYLIKLMLDDFSIFLGDSSVEFTILAKKINDFATSLSIQKKLYLNNKESASIEKMATAIPLALDGG